MKSYLVTGGAGFIGSHLVDYLLKTYPERQIINLDKLTYAGNINHLKHANQNKRHFFVKGDINDRGLLDSIFEDYDIDGIFHLAAESHVDNSIKGPAAFIETNICGTFSLLEKARAVQAQGKSIRFLHVSTDEVYGSLGKEGYFTEKSSYQPNSPYSASKASSDMLVRSYHKTYGMDAIITNCSNNFGPRQHAEKLIPTVISKAISGEKIPVYGVGAQIRDWLFVSDHCSALDKAFQKGISGEVYNIGTHQEMTNLELVKVICEHLDEIVPKKYQHQDLIEYVSDRPGHDFRYAIDSSKISQLGWQSQGDFNKNLRITIQWYIDALSPCGHNIKMQSLIV